MKNKFKPIVLLVLFFTVLTSICYAEPMIKEPNVSGAFYASDPEILSKDVEKFLTAASVGKSNSHIGMIIAPHAGYMYSGAVAGYSFNAARNEKYSTIIILAPSHHFPFDGYSVWEEGGLKTPLGVVPVDHQLAEELINAHEKITFKKSVFEKEHSVEVELPFIQKSFPNSKIVPIIIGQPSPETIKDFSTILKEVVGDRQDVLIVVSTDLSHYHTDQQARLMDHRTNQLIVSLDLDGLWKEHQTGQIEMCGFYPVISALLFAKMTDLTEVKHLKYANSGDITGDKDRVVGYSAFSFARVSSNEDVEPLNSDQKKQLLHLAEDTIDNFVRSGKHNQKNLNDPRLNEYEGAFVTIHKHGQLRGCIGRIIGSGPLCHLVQDMAIAASSEDPRFDSVRVEELGEIDVEISVLSKPWRIKTVEDIELGKHGVIVSRGSMHTGVFLPQVAEETAWSKEEFLNELCEQKARLPRNCWKDPETKIEVFTAEVFSYKTLSQ